MYTYRGNFSGHVATSMATLQKALKQIWTGEFYKKESFSNNWHLKWQIMKIKNIKSTFVERKTQLLFKKLKNIEDI